MDCLFIVQIERLIHFSSTLGKQRSDTKKVWLSKFKNTLRKKAILFWNLLLKTLLWYIYIQEDILSLQIDKTYITEILN